MNQVAKTIFAGVASFAVIGLTFLILFAVGYYFIVAFNKPGTPLFKELQPLQYFGIFLCFIAVLPFIQYFFAGFLLEAGSSVFSSMFDE